MHLISPLRLLLSLLLVVGGAILAAGADNTVTQVSIFLVFGVFAIAIIALQDQTEPQTSSAAVERQKEQLLLRGRSEAYQDIVDAISDPILLVRNAKVATANPAAKTVLGDHIIGEDVRIAIRHPAAADRLANPDARHSGEPTLLLGVGSPDQRWELRIRPLVDGLKLVVLSDQSNQHAAERMRTDFVANASHELRTPLAAIKGFVETLQDPEAGQDPDTRARFLQIMYNETDRMEKLVTDLMSLSRIEAEKYQLPETPVDLHSLIIETRNLFIDSRNKKENDFQILVADDLPMITGDKSQLAQLLHNLVSNALKYGGKGSPITISVKPNRSGSMLRLSVIDKGDGIAGEHIPRLTERFYRVDKGRSKSIGGTGLGLSIVKHITERHGGRLEIASEPGQGTTVAVTLPVIKTQSL